MTISSVKNFAQKAPLKPGVYQFKDILGRKIYVGKASSLRSRLKSYATSEDSRVRSMVKEATNIDLIQTDSDIEALILESTLIKEERPKYNVVMRDDKQYCYVAFTSGSFPRIYITHQPYWQEGQDDADFLGPFTDGAAIHTTLRYLRSIFPYCTCRQTHHNFCLNYHIGKCLGICCLKNPELKIEETELKHKTKIYRKNIRTIKEILSGEKDSVLKKLKKEMDDEAKLEHFGKAIDLRNTIERLERVFENARILKRSELMKQIAYDSSLAKVLNLPLEPRTIECYDISNIQGVHPTGAMVVFIDGKPSKKYYRKFRIKTVRGANDTAMLKEVLQRRFTHDDWLWPDLIVIDGGKGQLNAARSILKMHGITVPIISLAKDAKHRGHQIFLPDRKTGIPLKKLSMIARNLLLTIQNEAHRFVIGYYRKTHRLGLLKRV